MSDWDYRGIWASPRKAVLTPLFGNHQTFEDGQEEDTVYYELRHYVKLAANMNPNVLETLWIPLEKFDIAETPYMFLRNIRDSFMSKQIATTTIGYATAEFSRVKKKLERTGAMSHKNAMHVVRLMRMGMEALQTGQYNVERPDADELLHIKNGGWTLDELEAYTNDMYAKMKKVELTTDLPESPDREEIAETVWDIYNLTWSLHDD
jgi:predicted nucleotidyltransferase